MQWASAGTDAHWGYGCPCEFSNVHLSAVCAHAMIVPGKKPALHAEDALAALCISIWHRSSSGDQG